jgi:hypothetical protein
MNPSFVPFMSKFTSFLVIAFALLLTVSCTRNDAQREFEREAYRSPDGYTVTNPNNGEVIDNDPDDWRISPRFQGLITINPPFPNPVAVNQSIQIEAVLLVGVQSINGIEILVRLPDGSFKSLLPGIEQLYPSLNVFSISPLALGVDGSSEAARDLKRIYIFNEDSQLISYGDIMVE